MSPTSYQTAPPRSTMVANPLTRVKFFGSYFCAGESCIMPVEDLHAMSSPTPPGQPPPNVPQGPPQGPPQYQQPQYQQQPPYQQQYPQQPMGPKKTPAWVWILVVVRVVIVMGIAA